LPDSISKVKEPIAIDCDLPAGVRDVEENYFSREKKFK